MNMTASNVLAAVAGLLCVVALFKPQWPLLPVAGLLVAVAIIVK